MQITQLPALSRALQTGDVFAMEDSSGITRKVDVSRIQPTPLVLSIPTGQWSGSGNDRYITVTASNVTADSVLVPHYDNASAALLNGPVWCVPAAGSFTVHTSAIPSGTVNIMVQFVGTLGEAQYQVLADVYSTSQVDSKIAQSTAKIDIYIPSADNTISAIYGYLSQIPVSHSATIFMDGAITSIITNGASNMAIKGIVSHAGTNVYDFLGASGSGSGFGSVMYSWRVSTLTSSAITVGPVYSYTGTEI